MRDKMVFTKDSMKQKKVAVLYGGMSSERPVSLNSGEACFNALKEKGYNVELIDVGPDLAAQLAAKKIDVAFLALHGRYGEDGCVQGLLEVMGIPYSGSDVLSSAAAMDKETAKILFAAAGLPIVPHIVLNKGEKVPELPFGFPVVVKPNSEGSSFGVTIVKEAKDLPAAIAEAFKYDQVIHVEKFIAGKEITSGVLNGKALATLEIAVAKSAFYDYEAKYECHENRYIVPAPISDELNAKVLHLAERAYKVLRCSGAARADLIVEENATAEKGIYILEMNSLPGMTAASLLPKMASYAGLTFADLCEEILLAAHNLKDKG